MTDVTTAPKTTEPLLSHKETADLLGVSIGTLYTYRNKLGIGPKPVHAPGKGHRVQYRRADVLAWIEERDRAAAARA